MNMYIGEKLYICEKCGWGFLSFLFCDCYWLNFDCIIWKNWVLKMMWKGFEGNESDLNGVDVDGFIVEEE